LTASTAASNQARWKHHAQLQQQQQLQQEQQMRLQQEQQIQWQQQHDGKVALTRDSARDMMLLLPTSPKELRWAVTPHVLAG